MAVLADQRRKAVPGAPVIVSPADEAGKVEELS
jgi:hypothetical protein